jgi:predicted FMN-binding regulatory protein PaiB
MNINGKWYTETEAQAYITKLEKELAESQNVSDKIEQIMTHYTFAQQRQVFAEECAEAIQAAMKLSRAETVADYEKAAAALDSEVADVLIMAEQMKMYLGTEKVDAEILRKLDRQIERIKAEQEG